MTSSRKTRQPDNTAVLPPPAAAAAAKGDDFRPPLSKQTSTHNIRDSTALPRCPPPSPPLAPRPSPCTRFKPFCRHDKIAS